LEIALDELIAEHPEIPQPSRNVWIGPWEVDCYWPEHQLVVELDGGPYHITVGDIERDRVKDIWMQRHRLRIVRITDWRFEHDRDGIIGDLHAFTQTAA
jgi:very-short-patch-repair endonuclease